MVLLRLQPIEIRLPSQLAIDCVMQTRYSCFVKFNSLHPSEQFFIYVGMGLPVLNQY